MSSHIAWDFAFGLGMLVQLTKLTDMILRPHQQEWIQSSAEAITLHLAYFKPMKWYSRLVRKKPAIFFVIIVEMALVLTIVLSSMHELFFADRHPTGENYFATIFGSMVLLALAPIALASYLNQAMDWLFLHNHFLSFLIRFIPLAALNYLACFGLFIFHGAVIVENGTSHAPIISLALLFTGVSIFWTLLALGITVVLLEVILTLCTMLVGAIRFLAWRVVEYNKGAWAAISLLLTTIIGLVDIFLRLSTR